MVGLTSLGGRAGAVWRSIPGWALAPLAVTGFVVAVQLMGAAIAELAPALGPWLRRFLDPDPAALGASWLVAYVMLNGSVVAAVAISLFRADLITGGELFVLVVGSRLGAAGMVVLIGAIDHLQHRDGTLGESVGLGLYTVLVTNTIYLPVAVLGYAGLPTVRGAVDVSLPWLASVAGFLDLLGTGVDRVAGLMGGPIALALAVALFLVSLRAIDRLFARTDLDVLEERLAVLDSRWRSFAIGLLVTAVTTSVSVSIGIAVPLYNRGHLDRERMAPYVLGASLGTLTDTLVVAIVLQSVEGVFTVGYVFGVAGLFTLIALVAFDRYFGLIDSIQERLVGDRTAFVAFAAVLVAVPLALIGLAALN
ncbi:MAG: sodium:phosphate symporter [Halanaeroarchaeum sp.]